MELVPVINGIKRNCFELVAHGQAARSFSGTARCHIGCRLVLRVGASRNCSPVGLCIRWIVRQAAAGRMGRSTVEIRDNVAAFTRVWPVSFATGRVRRISRRGGGGAVS